MQDNSMENETTECVYCGKKYSKKGIGTHIWRNHGKGIGWNANNKNRTAWNKGLTKETSESLQKASDTMKRGFEEGRIVPPFFGRKHSEETREKWASNPNMGGLRQGSGRGNKGWYKGFYCRSTWELAWIVYQLEHGVKVRKCEEHFPYCIDGKWHSYYPDFMIDDIYYEIKGYRDVRVQEKIDQFPENKRLILIEGKKEIRPYLDYAISMYGNEFWKNLYESGLDEVGIIAD